MEEVVSIVESNSIHVVKLLEFQIREANATIHESQDLENWCKSDQGRWIIAHALEIPTWYCFDNPFNLSTHFVVTAKLEDRDYTHWLVKWKKLST